MCWRGAVRNACAVGDRGFLGFSRTLAVGPDGVFGREGCAAFTRPIDSADRRACFLANAAARGTSLGYARSYFDCAGLCVGEGDRGARGPKKNPLPEEGGSPSSLMGSTHPGDDCHSILPVPYVLSDLRRSRFVTPSLGCPGKRGGVSIPH